MSMELKQTNKLSQQLLMTPQLQQAIRLLQLSRLELQAFIGEQIAENPLLEEDHWDSQTNSQTDSESDSQSDSQSDSHTDNQIDSLTDRHATNLNKNDSNDDSYTSIDHQELTFKSSFDEEEPWENKDNSFSKKNKNNYSQQENSYENYLQAPKKLSDHLLGQISELDFNLEEKKIALLLIGNINEKGYLEISLEEFCATEFLDLEKTEGVLDTIQRLDPVGVGARDLKECLLIQLRELGFKNPMFKKIITHHFKNLMTNNYELMAKELAISLEETKNYCAEIHNLNPNPGHLFSNTNTDYIISDVYVAKHNGKWHAYLNEDGIPNLKIAPFYQNMGSELGKGKDKQYIHEKIKSASWLIKSIEQRQKTILRVANALLLHQLDFFEKGPKFLKPLILKDIAEELSLHESTISRVTSNKYLHSPRGIFELKYFFSSSVSQSNGSELASESIKIMIKQMLESEDLKKPLSDEKISTLLKAQGIEVARRTVAKYREALNILPSNQRKRYCP